MLCKLRGVLTEEDRAYLEALKRIHWGLDKNIAEAAVLDSFERTRCSAFDRFLNRLDRINKELDAELGGSIWLQRIARGIRSRVRLRRPASSGAPAAGSRSRPAAAGGKAYAAIVERIDALKAEIEARDRTAGVRARESETRLRLKIAELDAEIRLELGRRDREIKGLGNKLVELGWKTEDLDRKLVALERRLVALEKRRSVEQPAS